MLRSPWRLRVLAVLILISVFWLPSSAFAACASPVGDLGNFIYNRDYHVPQYCDGTLWKATGKVGGSGAGGTGCTDPVYNEGQFVYNNDYSVLQYCDGYVWRAMGKPVPPAPPSCEDTIGTVCADGSVYAGLSPDGNVAMYTTPADAAGTYKWSTVASIDTAMVNCISASPGAQASCQTGQANTTLLAGLANADAPYIAAAYCDTLSAHGHTDWYLPASDELNVLWTNRVAIGGFNLTGSPPAGYYWSSSEYNNSFARDQWFSDGLQTDAFKNGAFSVRCVR